MEAARRTTSPSTTLASPAVLRSRYDRLEGQRRNVARMRDAKRRRLAQVEDYLALAPGVDEALDKLSEELFGKLAGVVERQLTFAIQEVLGQAIVLKVDRDFKRGGATMRFHIERDGQAEDIMKGQGGSVANILSVGLRIFALSQLDSKKHRRFLVLDEQDCWLAPQLVPKLVKIVQQAGRMLGFQVVMISHHDIAAFEPYAQRIYKFTPTADGVSVEPVFVAPHPDEEPSDAR